MLKFIKAYIKTMRLYYAFLTGIAGWIGVSFYEFTTRTGLYESQVLPATHKRVLVLLFLFMVWGINQVVNDYLGLPEDRINAPNRPMVTGELNSTAALCVSVLLMSLVAVITWIYLEPVALVPMVIGIALNVVYEYAKGYGIWGNIIFGIMISGCVAYGFLASGPYAAPLVTVPRVGIMLLVVLLNGTMTYFTYFKDYKGDKRAGKSTIVVKYGLKKARLIGLLFSCVPAAAFAVLVGIGAFHTDLVPTFWLLALLAFGLQVYTAYLYFRYPTGEKTYLSLKVNFRACICGQAALIAIFDERLGISLFLLSYIFVGFLFDLTGDSKS